MKKFIALLCTLCMIATMVPFAVMAETDDGYTDIYATSYVSDTSDGTDGFTISADTKTGVSYKIEDVNGERVLTFRGEGEIPDFGGNSFSKISDAPWYDLSVTKVIIENGVTKIGARAFEGFNKIKSIEINSPVAEIGSYAFNACTALTSIVFPEGLTKIGSSIFHQSKNVTEITLPASLPIGTATELDSKKYNNAPNGKYHFTTVNVPDGSKAQEWAEAYKTTCAGLGDDAFDVTINITHPAHEWADAAGNLFTWTYDNGTLVVDKSPNNTTSGAMSGSKAAFTSPWRLAPYDYYADKFTDIELKSGVTAIGRSAFDKLTGLTELTIPGTINNTEWGAFAGCTALKKVVFEEGFTNLKQKTFNGCIALEEVVLPSTLTNIGNEIFHTTSQDIKLTINNANATNIASSMFEGYTGTCTVYLPNDGTTKTQIATAAANNANCTVNIAYSDSYKFWDCSSAAGLSSNIGWIESCLSSEYSDASLGGKVGDTYVTYTGSANEAVIYGKNDYSTRYFAMSINAYGKSIRDFFPRLGSSSYKPSLVAEQKFGGNLKGHLTDDIWNNVFFVFDSQTKDMKTYVNGVLKANVNLYDIVENVYEGTVDRTAGTAKISTTDVSANLMNLKEDLRILLNNGSASYIDDLAFWYSENEPTPAEYVADITGATVKGDYIVIDGATANISGSTVYVNNAATTTLNVGDKAVIVTNTPYGNIYKTYTVINNTISLATMDTMSFIQGGYPWIADENGTVANEDGVMGKNIAPTGAGNNVLITEAGNIFGSKYTMKELTIGYNSKNSVQTYYEAKWKKAEVEALADYLVLEANFAFPNSEHATAISLSTDKGTGIGTRIPFGATNDARVNHYMWIYDIQAGTYVDYLNGAALVDEPVAVDATFADGTKKTALRFGFSGTTKMADETYGTYEGGLKGYMADLEVYGAVNRPAVKTAPSLTGAVGTYYPIYDVSEFTLDSIKALAPDADNVYVYENRAFGDELTEGADKASYFYMIITEKDDIYGYYRVCRLPNADATYALETISPNAKEVTVNILNLSDGQDITAILAEYNGDDFVKCKLAVQKDVAYGDTFGIKITDVTAGNNVTLYGWDNLNDIQPLGDAVVVK